MSGTVSDVHVLDSGGLLGTRGSESQRPKSEARNPTLLREVVWSLLGISFVGSEVRHPTPEPKRDRARLKDLKDRSLQEGLP